MKIFREQLDHRRELNRNRRFGGWKGLIFMIVAFCVVLFMIRGCTVDKVSGFFDFWTSGQTELIAH